MATKHLAAAAVAGALVIGGYTFALGLQAPNPAPGGALHKVSSAVLGATLYGQRASFIVYLRDQADLGAAYAMRDHDARGWYVYRTLRDQAAATQAGVRAQLDARRVAYTPYWAVNMVVVHDAGRELVEALAARADVAAIESNAVVKGFLGEDTPESTDDGAAADAVETGVTQTQAPQLWSLGFRGAGMVIANQDTGMRWTHSTLRTHYRGWGGSVEGSAHDYNWWDSIHGQITTADGGAGSPAVNPCGRNLAAPCDDNGHGTHTTGTVIGDDAGAGVGTGTNQVGVAPEAQWIGCRNMDSGNGRASTYTECFQFFLAPTDVTGANADPARRPHVMNNSWGCPQAGELCAPNVMRTVVENAAASGILVVASNGNNGPDCDTTTDPPAIYESAFSVGSLTSANAVSAFSSRGRVPADGSNRMKPDIAARGSSVRSATRTNDTAYATLSGTSMAGPHIVGTVALLWNARPDLERDVPRTKWLLTRSANPAVTVPVADNPWVNLPLPPGTVAQDCGGIASQPNNHFGWGAVDVLAAYDGEPELRQAIAFPAIPPKQRSDPDFPVAASASSGLPLTYSAAGACTVADGTVHITGYGACTVTASQAGVAEYRLAADAPTPWYPAEAAQTFGILFPFTGFFAPVANDGVNVAKAGRSLPVKFGLGGDHGLDVLAAGSPASTAVACGSGEPAGAATPASGALGYSSLSGQYTYDWKTDRAWAGSCRRFELTLADGSVHAATFEFRTSN